jgi:5S rRNA maturation endonuclease (ribonuclease M5)
MNMINPQFIKDYITEKVKCDYRISSNNQELIMPSLFVPNDFKRHMSVNMDTGLWQCFKTGKQGNFVKLYSIVEDIPYKKAQSKLLFQGLEDGTLDIWDSPTATKEAPEQSLFSINTENFAPVNVDSYDSNQAPVLNAWKFLMDRKLFNLTEYIEEPYYVCLDGKYKDRLIIPFKDYDDKMFFFQARALSHFAQPKYLNPNSENGAKSSNILYPFDYDADHLCICEGPLDAISLQLNGINATCTVGSSISRVQMQMLREFEGKIILAYDNDEAGKRGIERFNRMRKQLMLPTAYIVSPPSEHKDWNEAHIRGVNLNTWINNNLYEYSTDNVLLDRLKEI